MKKAEIFKRMCGLLLTAAMLLGLAACGGNSTEPTSKADPVTETANVGNNGSGEKAGKTLVVYFSASGNTERVAKDIAAAANADLFEIVPSTPYSSDDLNYRDESSRVVKEYNDESLRDIPLTSTAVENWADYDTVFIGYPIWWQIAAWPVNNFVKDNDFTGKKVIPFATSASSGMGESGALLAELAGGGEWQEGKRFSSGASSDEVRAWLADLEV